MCILFIFCYLHPNADRFSFYFQSFMKYFLHKLICFLYFPLHKWFLLSLSIASSIFGFLVFTNFTSLEVYVFSFNSQSFLILWFISHVAVHSKPVNLPLLQLSFYYRTRIAALIRFKCTIIFIALIISTLSVAEFVWCKIKREMSVNHNILDDPQFKEH